MLKLSATALALSLALTGCATTGVQDTRTATTVQVEEDHPLWDCQTMGNLQCEPAITPAIEAQAWTAYDALGFAYETPKRVSFVALSYTPFEDVPPHTITVQDHRTNTYYLFKLEDIATA